MSVVSSAAVRLKAVDPHGTASKIAEVFFDANLLTVQLLENELRLFVVEAAVVGKWFQSRFSDAELIEIFGAVLTADCCI